VTEPKIDAANSERVFLVRSLGGRRKALSAPAADD
jgi:hypothetical protein